MTLARCCRVWAVAIAGSLAVILPIAPDLRGIRRHAIDHLLETSPYSVGDPDDPEDPNVPLQTVGG